MREPAERARADDEHLIDGPRPPEPHARGAEADPDDRRQHDHEEPRELGGRRVPRDHGAEERERQGHRDEEHAREREVAEEAAPVGHVVVPERAAHERPDEPGRDRHRHRHTPVEARPTRSPPRSRPRRGSLGPRRGSASASFRGSVSGGSRAWGIGAVRVGERETSRVAPSGEQKPCREASRERGLGKADPPRSHWPGKAPGNAHYSRAVVSMARARVASQRAVTGVYSPVTSLSYSRTRRRLSSGASRTSATSRWSSSEPRSACPGMPALPQRHSSP